MRRVHATTRSLRARLDGKVVEIGASLALLAGLVAALVMLAGSGLATVAQMPLAGVLIVSVSAVFLSLMWAKRMPPIARLRRARRRALRKLRDVGLPGLGDYVSCDGRLYRVELMAADGLLLEDCRTGRLAGLDLADWGRLTRIRSGRPRR
jgi:hypothetical protein